MKEFKSKWIVRMADTDPFGIVFYPRYFEMVNGLVEIWCADALNWPFREQLIDQKVGLPTVHLEADFIRPSVLGDELDLTLSVLTLGRTSLTISVRASCQAQERFVVRSVLVLAESVNYKAQPFAEEIRERIAAYLVD